MIELVLLFGILAMLGGLLAAVKSGFNEVIKGLQALDAGLGSETDR